MTGRFLPAGTYGFDDLAEGDRIDAGTRKVTAEAIDAFADLTGDRFEIHMSDAAASRHGFPGRVAHGLLVLSMVDGMKNLCPAQFRAQASLSWDWTFHAPVIAGDSIAVTITVAERRPIRAPERGILRLEFDVTNQRGETVQNGENLLMVYR